MNYFNADFWEGGVFRKEFAYPSEEDALHQYMAAFNNRLSAVVAGQKARRFPMNHTVPYLTSGVVLAYTFMGSSHLHFNKTLPTRIRLTVNPY